MPTVPLERPTAMEEPENLLTVEKVARMLGFSKRTVYRMAENGEIPAYYMKGMWRFKMYEIHEWIMKHRNQPID